MQVMLKQAVVFQDSEILFFQRQEIYLLQKNVNIDLLSYYSAIRKIICYWSENAH